VRKYTYLLLAKKNNTSFEKILVWVMISYLSIFAAIFSVGRSLLRSSYEITEGIFSVWYKLTKATNISHLEEIQFITLINKKNKFYMRSLCVFFLSLLGRIWRRFHISYYQNWILGPVLVSFFWDGAYGYHCNIKLINPAANKEMDKKCSALKYYG